MRSFQNVLFIAAVWVPEDAVVHPKNLSKVFAYLAYMNGVKFIGDVTVKQVMTQFTNLFGPSSNINYRVHGVETDQVWSLKQIILVDSQLSNLQSMLKSVSKGFDPAIRTGTQYNQTVPHIHNL